MGKVLAKVMKKLSADGPKRILMLGLDNAGNYNYINFHFFLKTIFIIGKTTILYRMKRTEDFHTVPTIGMFIILMSIFKMIF